MYTPSIWTYHASVELDVSRVIKDFFGSDEGRTLVQLAARAAVLHAPPQGLFLLAAEASETGTVAAPSGLRRRFGLRPWPAGRHVDRAQAQIHRCRHIAEGFFDNRIEFSVFFLLADHDDGAYEGE